MLTTKNWRATLGLLAIAILAGCVPPGPRALLDGERLIREGKHAQAIPKLQLAAQLLPVNAQAWNHLGLAYHKAGQPGPALKAYEQARRCDLNLRPVRYNLGCLLLEQNNPQAAIAELTAFTLLERESPDGWLKLGIAQLRSRQWDGADRSLQNAVRLRPNFPEAWNALGIAYTQRKRTKEAWNSFSQALQKQPAYPPALLNLAVLYHHSLKNFELALQKYREYLASKPTPQDAVAVAQVVRQLQADIAAAAVRATNAAVPLPSGPASSLGSTPADARLVTNQGVARTATNVVAPAILASSTNPPPESNTTVSANALVSRAAEPTRHQQPLLPTVAPLKPAANPPKIDTFPKVEVVQLPQEPPPKPAQDRILDATQTEPVADMDNAAISEQRDPLLVRRSETRRREVTKDKLRMSERLNPTTWFRGKPQAAVRPTPIHPSPETKPESAPQSVSAVDRPAAGGVPSLAPRAMGRRYTYRSPAKPAAGDRVKAETRFARAVEAHRDRRLTQAVEGYRDAIRSDPSFFEAQYNLGLAAYELRDLPESLSAYETALSINPTSENARYNFAVALEMGDYYEDAAGELAKLLELRPDEVRAHFSLASLYAEKLFKPDLARRHYRRVLDLQPHHAQASAIRYWLAASP